MSTQALSPTTVQPSQPETALAPTNTTPAAATTIPATTTAPAAATPPPPATTAPPAATPSAPATAAPELFAREVARLCAAAKSRKRNRLAFFNSKDGLFLRLAVKNHEHLHAKVQLYCALCGQNRGSKFRGHRSVIKCTFCDVHLCLKTHQGFTKSCWDAWHSADVLSPRQPAGYSNTVSEENDKGDEDELSHSPQKHNRQLPAKAPRMKRKKPQSSFRTLGKNIKEPDLRHFTTGS